MTRYARQITLPEVGENGQATLAGARVAVIGAGGLGCPVLHYLAGAGVGHLTIIDPDHVEESNLHRQTLYASQDIGRPKTLAAQNRLRQINPQVTVEAKVTALDPANAAHFARGAQVVIDAADSFMVSYTLSDLCLATGTPLISASAQGLNGYVGGFCGGAPSLRAVFPTPPEDAGTCASAGVMGPVVGMLGAAQAQIALQVLLGTMPSPLGHMITLDMGDLRCSSFDFLGAAEPATPFPFLAKSDLRHDDQVIDLRPKDEAPKMAHPLAHRFQDHVSLNPDRRIVLCCTTGLRAWRKAENLSGVGFKHIALHAAGRSE